MGSVLLPRCAGGQLAEQDLVRRVAGRPEGGEPRVDEVAVVHRREVSTPFVDCGEIQPIWSGSFQSDQRVTRGSSAPSTLKLPE